MNLAVPDLERYLWALGVGVARTAPIAWLIPVFGGPSVPPPVRLGLGLSLSALCLPLVLGGLPTEAPVPFWLLLLAREVAVGLTVGLVGATLFRAAEAAGRLVDVLRGANLAEVISPMGEGRTSPLGDIYGLLAVVLFLELGGVRFIAMALARSYEAVPLTLSAKPAQLAAAAALVARASGMLIEATVALVAPALVAFLLADLVLAAVARLAPHVPMYFAAMPLKALAGVGVVLLGLGGLEAALVAGFEGWAALVGQGFSVWR